MHMAIGAVINAAWDMAGRRAGKPVWRLIADMSPEQIVGLIDFRYITDALTRDEALAILRAAAPGRAERIQTLFEPRISSLHNVARLAGYSDEKLARLSIEAGRSGVSHDQTQGWTECGR